MDMDTELARMVAARDTETAEALIGHCEVMAKRPVIQDGKTLARELRRIGDMLPAEDWTLLRMQWRDLHHSIIEAANALEEFGV